MSFILTPYKEHNLALFVNRFLNTGAWHFMINFQIQFKTFPKLLNSKYFKRYFKWQNILLYRKLFN